MSLEVSRLFVEAGKIKQYFCIFKKSHKKYQSYWALVAIWHKLQDTEQWHDF